MILTLCGILLAGYWVQLTFKEDPCPLCLLQRLGMIGIATGALLNLKFGIRVQHYAVCLFSTILGGSIAIRQILLHICPDFPTFGYPVFGLSLYAWAFISFFCVGFALAIMLFIYEPEKEPLEMHFLDKFAFGTIVLITFANIITTIYLCGLESCH